MTLFLFSLFVLIVVLFITGLAVLGVAFLDLIGYVWTEVPFVPASPPVVRAVVRLAPKNTGVFYDLGSGEGRVVIAVAEAYPNIKAVGVERAPLPTIATWLGRKSRPPNASFLFQDARRVSLKNASYVYLYLLPKVVRKFEQKLEEELAPGSRLVCCDFPLKNRPADETQTVTHGKKSHTLYVYDV